jgi:hypothetical protein
MTPVLYVVFIFLMLLVSIFVTNRSCKKDQILVILYDTDFNNDYVRKYISTLKMFGYNYKIIGDESWKGFGKKIKTLEYYLNSLPSDQIVVVSDARDVFVARHAKDLMKHYESLAKNKILVSTELGCCESLRKKKPPGSLRLLNGESNQLDITDDSSPHKWVTDFQKLANKNLEGVKWKWTNPNAGLYMGKVKDILKMYKMMNISGDKEDDQSVLSEIILQHEHMFVLDYLSNIFSSSFKWNPNSKEIHGGCYYKKNSVNGMIENLIFHSYPFFFHFPAKHFTCYDKVYDMV